MTERLRIEIFPADLDQSLAFYEALGFRVAGRSDGPPRYASIRLGEVRIGVCEAHPVDPAVRSIPAGTEIVIDVDDIDSCRDVVVSRGVSLTEDLTHQPWGLADFRVTDPDGYYLRFTDHRWGTRLRLRSAHFSCSRSRPRSVSCG